MARQDRCTKRVDVMAEVNIPRVDASQEARLLGSNRPRNGMVEE